MEEKVEKIQEHAKLSSGAVFRLHFMVFLLIMVMLFVINLVFTPSYLWALYPLFSWLIAIILHLSIILTKNIKSSKRALLGHLATYLSVNLLLIVINLLTSEKLNWAFYPIFFWGIGVLFQAIVYREYFSKKTPEVKEGKLKQKLKPKPSRFNLKNAELKRKNLLSAYGKKVVETIVDNNAVLKTEVKTSPKLTIKPKNKLQSEIPQHIDLSEEDKKELEQVESEMDIEEKEVFCVVHKGPIVGTVYICPQCKTYYCFKCAKTLKKGGETCWSCGAELNP